MVSVSVLANGPQWLPTATAGRDALVLALLMLCARQRQQMSGMTERIRVLEEEKGRLTAERDQAQQRGEELSRGLRLDSKNSSKPPSSDGLKRRSRCTNSPERERRKRLGRRAGKQKGAPGHHLAPVTEPGHVIELLPAYCGNCGLDFGEDATEAGMDWRQVLDQPPPQGLVSTEYRALKLRCAGCCRVTRAAFPEWARARVSYGPRLHATANYLAVQQHIPYERMKDLLHEVCGMDLSTGALVAMVARGGERVRPAVEEIGRQLRTAEAVHLDETGAHVGGELKWVHGAATDRLTLLGIADHRGRKGITSLGVTEDLRGIAIHDSWSSYWGDALPNVRGHALCNAHHLRELAAVTDLDGQRWSWRMSNLLLEMLAARNQAMERRVRWNRRRSRAGVRWTCAAGPGGVTSGLREQ